MTRKRTAELLPIIEAFARGERIEVYDTSTLQDVFPYHRGVWIELTNIGFGAPPEYYRIAKTEDETENN